MSTMISFKLLKKKRIWGQVYERISKTLVFEKDPEKPGVYKEIDGTYWDISLVLKNKSIVVARRHTEAGKELAYYFDWYPHNYILAEAFLENPEEEEDKEKLMNEYCDAVLGACGL